MALLNRPKKSALDKRKITNPVVQTRNRLIATIAIGVALCAAMYFLYTSPALARQSVAQGKLAAATTANAAANAEFSVSSSLLSQEAATTYHATTALDNMLPESPNPNTITLTTLPNLVKASGCKGPSNITPGLPQSQFGASAYAYSVQIDGTYANIARFIRLLSEQQELFTIPTFSLTTAASAPGTPTNNTQYTAALTIDAWYLPGVPLQNGSTTVNAG